MKEYVAGQSIIEINVSPKLSTIRPYICCSSIKEIHLSDAIIKGIMHLQDKLDQRGVPVEFEKVTSRTG